MRELVDSLCRDGADTPISLNKCNGSELWNAAAHITWPTSDSTHDKTLKGGKIHRYSEIAKTPISLSSSSNSSSNGLAQNCYMYLP